LNFICCEILDVKEFGFKRYRFARKQPEGCFLVSCTINAFGVLGRQIFLAEIETALAACAACMDVKANKVFLPEILPNCRQKRCL